jgi:hypothetical protein
MLTTWDGFSHWGIVVTKYVPSFKFRNCDLPKYAALNPIKEEELVYIEKASS